MNSRLVTLRSILALAACAAVGHVHAAEDASGYVGLSLGAAAIEARGYDLAEGQSHARAGVSPGAFAGLQLGTLPVLEGWPLSVEIGWQQIARHRIDYKTASGTSALTARGQSVSLSAKVDAPLTQRFGLYGRLGVARNAVHGSVPDGQTPIAIDGHRAALSSAFGLQYGFDAGWTLRGELVGFGNASANSRAYGANLAVARRF